MVEDISGTIEDPKQEKLVLGRKAQKEFHRKKICYKGLEPYHTYICISVPNSLLPNPRIYWSVFDMLSTGLEFFQVP